VTAYALHYLSKLFTEISEPDNWFLCSQTETVTLIS